MNLLTILNTFAALANRIFESWQKHEQNSKHLKRKERRESVAKNPKRAFARLFGQPERLHDNTEKQRDSVRSNAAKTPVE